jgi:hypothetical protein
VADPPGGTPAGIVMTVRTSPHPITSIDTNQIRPHARKLAPRIVIGVSIG